MRWRMSSMEELPREAGVAANYLLEQGVAFLGCISNLNKPLYAPIFSLLCRLGTLTPVPQMTTSYRPVSLLVQGRIDRTFQVLDNRMHGRDGRGV